MSTDIEKILQDDKKNPYFTFTTDGKIMIINDKKETCDFTDYFYNCFKNKNIEYIKKVLSEQNRISDEYYIIYLLLSTWYNYTDNKKYDKFNLISFLDNKITNIVKLINKKKDRDISAINTAIDDLTQYVDKYGLTDIICHGMPQSWNDSNTDSHITSFLKVIEDKLKNDSKFVFKYTKILSGYFKTSNLNKSVEIKQIDFIDKQCFYHALRIFVRIYGLNTNIAYYVYSYPTPVKTNKGYTEVSEILKELSDPKSFKDLTKNLTSPSYKKGTCRICVLKHVLLNLLNGASDDKKITAVEMKEAITKLDDKKMYDYFKSKSLTVVKNCIRMLEVYGLWYSIPGIGGFREKIITIMFSHVFKITLTKEMIKKLYKEKIWYVSTEIAQQMYDYLKSKPLTVVKKCIRMLEVYGLWKYNVKYQFALIILKLNGINDEIPRDLELETKIDVKNKIKNLGFVKREILHQMLHNFDIILLFGGNDLFTSIHIFENIKTQIEPGKVTLIEDKNGEKTTVIISNDGGLEVIKQKNGKKTSEVTYDKDGKKTSKVTYDEDGEATLELLYNRVELKF